MRQVIIAKTTGIAIHTIPTMNTIAPKVSAALGSWLPPMSIFALGMKLIKANIAPVHRQINPGKPQVNAVTKVATMPVVRLSILTS